jgi:hypothetical protein
MGVYFSNSYGVDEGTQHIVMSKREEVGRICMRLV